MMMGCAPLLLTHVHVPDVSFLRISIRWVNFSNPCLSTLDLASSSSHSSSFAACILQQQAPSTFPLLPPYYPELDQQCLALHRQHRLDRSSHRLQSLELRETNPNVSPGEINPWFCQKPEAGTRRSISAQPHTEITTPTVRSAQFEN